MLVRDVMATWASQAGEDEAAAGRLPRRLKRDADPVREGLMKRLAASRTFALGDRSGVLKAAQARSGRPFRWDARQRVVVKVLVSRHRGRGAARSAALGAHLAYLGRAGAGADGARAEYFDGDTDRRNVEGLAEAWRNDRHHFRLIISPEHGDRLANLRDYTREVMRRVAADLGEPDLTWAGVCHYDTDQPHAHVLVRGRRADGRDLVIPRDYVAYGLRARAQEVAQERLGDLSRVDAECRVWRETAADRFTRLDSRLIAAADAAGQVDDGVGSSAVWSALSRGRLRHLESLGLAVRTGRRYRLDENLEHRLRRLQASRDIIRTLNQRRLEGGRDVRALGKAVVRGRVVASGFHDEAGAAPWVMVRDGDGREHYARLGAGAAKPRMGTQITLAGAENGLARMLEGKGADIAR